MILFESEDGKEYKETTINNKSPIIVKHNDRNFLFISSLKIRRYNYIYGE